MHSKVPSSTSPTVTTKDIAQRAREIWHGLGCPAGRDVEIWLQAERELTLGAQEQKQRRQKLPKKEAVKTDLESGQIDVGELQESLGRVGEAAPRSPTSLNVS